MTAPLRLAVHWHPEDQAWQMADQGRRGGPMRVQGWVLLAGGAVLALAAPLMGRLADWAVENPYDPAPLLTPLAWDDAAASGLILAVSLAMALLLTLAERAGLRTLLEARAAEGREPLLGPVEVILSAEDARFRGEGWESRFDSSLLTGREERSGYILLLFGAARRVILPVRDLSAAEASAVRGWADGILSRRP